MANPHSSVIYVEPNSMEYDWNSNKKVEKAPRLEDYCIALNIEVEVCSRNISGNDLGKEVILLSWDNNKDKVSFMGGTKIGGYQYSNEGGRPVRTPKINGTYNALTTYYADMYVGDLVDYGTTEMVGIKSVNIEYVKNCVPMITVQFTDVRGLSLFQPTELSRDNTYNGIKGLSQSNIAQSFFQCFYKMPLPKFTIYVKGFYGEPVSYEMMCDKFDTDFNSDNGNFDCTAHFVGYSYSFMTDVSLDALIVAPYSDYIGKKYWNDKVNSLEFYVWDKTHTTKIPMPTLYDAKANIEKILASSDKSMEYTTITEEEKNHDDEIQVLKRIKDLYTKWYEALFALLQEKYGKQYCFLFREDGEDGCYYRIMVLTNSDTSNIPNLSADFTQFSDTFKTLNHNLNASVKTFNASNGFVELKNISEDFSDYTRHNIFNDCYINSSTRKVTFGGFSSDCKLPKKEVLSNLFSNGNTEQTLLTIYGDGVKQYTDAYVINVEYSEINRRINMLNKDASRNVEDKTKEKAIKQHNQYMLSQMNWYPSVENFTRIMLAHLETLMAMMYKLSDEIKSSDRTAENLGVKMEDMVDLNKSDKTIPPFPRVTEKVIGDDGIAKIEDAWIGDLIKGQGFKEVEIIDGIFNAVEELADKEKDDSIVKDSIIRAKSEEYRTVKCPLTPFDFFVNKNIYGEDSDTTNNINVFAAKIAIRMYDILGINAFSRMYNDWKIDSLVKTIAESEAVNFYNSAVINNRKFLEILGNSDDSGAINSDAIIKLLTEKESIDKQPLPWGDKALFDASMKFIGYNTEKNGTIYPIQDISFSKLDETFQYFNSGKIQVENKDILLDSIKDSFYEQVINSSNDSVFNTIYFEDDFNSVKTKLDNAMENVDECYKPIYNILLKNSGIDADELGKMVLTTNTCFCLKNGKSKKNKIYFYSGDTLNEIDVHPMNEESQSVYGSEAVNGNINSFTFTETFGFSMVTEKNNYRYTLNKENSLFNRNDYNFDSDVHRMAFFATSLDCIDYSNVLKSLQRKVFNYVPKLAVLQIGAILYANQNNLDIPISENESIVLTYLDKLKPMAKIVYIKNFIKWANNNYANVRQLFVKQKSAKGYTNSNINYSGFYKYINGESHGRCFFNENSDLVKSLTNTLMSPLLVVNASVFHNGGVANAVNKGTVKAYLDAFLEKLRMLYGKGYKEDESGNMTKVTKTPKNTTKDMKKELYRYLKLLYDKWVPNYTLDEWNYELFFKYDDNLELTERPGVNGHRFHFIDSYYNKIGDKLLINPLKLAEKLSAAFLDNKGDVSVMMLGFMADIYAQNKCMLLSLHNFMDLSNKNAMNKMFKPISFNEMTKPRKHPDFVVVYPYEPSKHLNIDNAEYTNDGFMLNEEMDTPIAIRSRAQDNGKYYRIPAFGVTYGKQYQSYFKKVNVNTKSPIATQQSIMAKHSILRRMNDNKPSGVVGQDLYDIYTTQSYTCTVEMMGCAWVQPLMYFVLLNVPMFRGSYMIFKVTHRITPGDMTTTFMGTRMCNVSNTLSQDIFTDESNIEDSTMYEESSRERNANVDNDCPYKVYPLVENENLEISGDAKRDGINILSSLVTNYGFNEKAAAGIVGNMYVESYDVYNTKKRFKYDLVVADNKKGENGTSGGLCMWRNENLIALSEKNVRKFGVNKTIIQPTSGNVSAYSSSLRSNGLEYQLNFLKKSMTNEAGWTPYDFNTYNSEATSPTIAASLFQEKYERGVGKEKERQGFAQEIYNVYKSGSITSSTNADDKKLNNTDVRELFYQALYKSCNSTKAISGSIICSYSGTTTSSNKKVIGISGNGDDLAIVFDIILNGYYKHVQTLWWSYPNSFGDKPTTIYVEPSMEVKSGRKIFVVKGNNLSPTNLQFTQDANEQLLRALSKKYYNVEAKYVNAEVPQLNGDMTPLNKYKPTSCDDVIGGNVNSIASAVNPLPKNSIIKAKKGTKYKDWNVYNAIQHLVTHAKPKYSKPGKCASYVENAIAAGGIPRPYCGGNGEATRLRYEGILEDNGFDSIYNGMLEPNSTPKGNFQAGDIAIIGNNANKGVYPKNYHACMYTGEKWVSDFVQNNMSPYGQAYPYAVFRYQNNQITNT